MEMLGVIYGPVVKVFFFLSQPIYKLWGPIVTVVDCICQTAMETYFIQATIWDKRGQSSQAAGRDEPRVGQRQEAINQMSSLTPSHPPFSFFLS